MMHDYKTLPDFLATTYPRPAMLLHPWIQAGSIGMLYGARGGGKTGVSIALGLAVACGASLCGDMYAPGTHRVLYVDGEMHPSEMQARLGKFLAGMPGVWPTPKFAYLSHAFLENGTPDLSESRGQGYIEREINAHDADLVILDNISALFRTGEENSNDSVVPVNEWLVRLRRYGVATLLIHHAGKRDMEGRLRQRGASKREDILNAVVQVDETAKPRDGRVPIKLTYEKFRSFTPANLETHCSLIYDDAGERAWIEDGAASRRENQEPPRWLASAQRMHAEGASYGAIALALSQPKPTVYRWLKTVALGTTEN